MHLEHLNSLIYSHYKNYICIKKCYIIKTFFLDSTYIMCLLIINKYLKRPNYLFNIAFIEFVTNSDIVNLRKKWKAPHIIHYMHYCAH